MRLSLRLGLGLVPQLYATVSTTALSLSFSTASVLDSRITFTRASLATMYDNTGKLTYAPNNELTRSSEFENAAWTQDFVTTTANATTAPDGTTTADLVIPTAVSALHSVRRFTSGAATPAIVSVYAKAGGYGYLAMTPFANVGVSNWTVFDLNAGTVTFTGFGLNATITSVGNGWYRCSARSNDASVFGRIDFGPSNNATGSQIFTGDGVSGIYLWGAQVEAVTYETTPRTYNATTASAFHGARLDHNPSTLAALGLLIEEARTNAVTYSEDFSNVAWTKTNGAVATNTVISPDGTTTADTFTPDTANNLHKIASSNAAVNSTVSIFVKPNGYTKVGLREDSSQGSYASFNLSGAGTVLDQANAGTGTASGATVTLLANGWYRISVYFTPSPNLALFVLPDSYTTGAITNAWVPNGTSGVYIWGAQIEAGAFATSYIPTVAATVTRAADSASMTGTNFSSWFNASEGTFVVESTEVEGAGSSKSFAARKGATTSLIRAGRNFGTGQGSGDVFNAGSAQAQIVTANAWNSAAFNKIAFAYKLNDVGVSLNGGAAATDMIATIPTDCDELSIGTNGVGPIINGHIKSLTFFNTRKTNAELVTLST